MSRHSEQTAGRLGRWFGRGPREEDTREEPAADRGDAVSNGAGRAGVVELVAPAAGQLVPLDDVADPAFSAGLLGPGAAVRPSSGEIVAPVDGTLVSVMPHAYGLRSDQGVEVLVHIGIDTVSLKGRHFETRAEAGARVAAGQPLAEVDLPALAAEGFDTSVMLVVTNAGDLGGVAIGTLGRVAAGDPVCHVTTH